MASNTAPAASAKRKREESSIIILDSDEDETSSGDKVESVEDSRRGVPPLLTDQHGGLLKQLAMERAKREREGKGMGERRGQAGAHTAHSDTVETECIVGGDGDGRTEGRDASATGGAMAGGQDQPAACLNLKILSYNVWFEESVCVQERMEAIGLIIQQHDPHFVLLQVAPPRPGHQLRYLSCGRA